MATKIALFNIKGGVSKRTTTFNLGWMLAEREHRVVVVDAAPRCNLAGMVLDVGEEGSLDRSYDQHPKRGPRLLLIRLSSRVPFP